MTDTQAIKLIQNGETEAFAIIIRRYHQRIFQLVYRLVWNFEEAEDLTQEIMMKSYQNIKKFDTSANFYTWLYRIAVNTVLTHLKKNYRKRREWEFREDFHAAKENSPAKLLEDKQQVEVVHAALVKLSPKYQMILTLREIEGLSYAEIARRLDCSIGTVMSRLSRARKELMTRLQRSMP